MEYREFVESLPAVFYRGKPGHALEYISPQVETLLGTPAGAWLGDPERWWSRVHPDDRERARRDTAVADRTFAVEYRILRADGRWRTVRDTGFLRGGVLRGCLLDLTERAFQESQFLQAQKLDAIGRLAGGMAHDFNNILTVVTGYSDLLLADLKPDHPMRPALSEIHAAGQRASGLTRRLLSFSRKQEESKSEPVDLYVLVSGMRSMLRRTISEDIHLEFSGTHAGPVMIDPGHLEQVLLNLVNNARDAMPAGGTILIETGEIDYEGARCAMLLVRDNGCGMSADTQARLFEPFFTTKPAGKGTGLGLATTWSIVRQAGGTILVQSEIGRGTTFRVLVPRVEGHGLRTILLVEDEERVRILASRILGSRGYRVYEAADGEQALGIAGEHKPPIHLLMTDQVMPKMTGVELAERFLKLHPEAKVLILSGYSNEGATLPPGYAFLEKPFTAESLTRKVRELLERDG